MLSALDFETLAAPDTGAADRTDVACFIGCVARRDGGPLPPAIASQLERRGWHARLPGISQRRWETLWHLPVTVDSWEAFDALFAWERRELVAGGGAACATYLGAAVRSYFAAGGRRAVIVSVGAPWPYLRGADREQRRRARLFQLLPWRMSSGRRPFDPTAPAHWRGVEHLYGLPEASHLCLPDLADICAAEPPPLRAITEPAPAPEVFVECSHDEPALEQDQALHRLPPPRLEPDRDDDGGSSDAANARARTWTEAVNAACGFLAGYRRDALFVGALPLPGRETRHGPVHAQADWLGYLQRAGVFETPAQAEGRHLPEDAAVGAASAFAQLAWPWVRSVRSTDLPGHLEPADGLLAGLLAANALARGTFRSVAGQRLPGVVEPVPMPDLGLGADSPTARLARRVCLIGPEPEGIVLLSDVTSSPRSGWRQGGASRLMAALLRAARRIGEEQAFQPNGPVLWARVRGDFEALLEAFRQAGALGGDRREQSYQVRCGSDTMTRNDLDNGRLRVEVTVLPANAVERITVALGLATGGRVQDAVGEVA